MRFFSHVIILTILFFQYYFSKPNQTIPPLKVINSYWKYCLQYRYKLYIIKKKKIQIIQTIQNKFDNTKLFTLYMLRHLHETIIALVIIRVHSSRIYTILAPWALNHWSGRWYANGYSNIFPAVAPKKTAIRAPSYATTNRETVGGKRADRNEWSAPL